MDFIHTRLHNIRSITKKNPMPEMWISKSDAKENGVLDKAVVTVETKNGSGKYIAVIKTEQKKGLLALDFGWGNPSDDGADFNSLTDDSICDPICGGSPNRIFRARIVV